MAPFAGRRVRLSPQDPVAGVLEAGRAILATGSYSGSFRGQLHSFARLAERERLSKLII